MHASEVAHWDPAKLKDLTAIMDRCAGDVIVISVDVDCSKPNMFDYLRGKFQEYKPVRSFGITTWVKK